MFQSPLSRGTPPDQNIMLKGPSGCGKFQSPLSRGTPPDRGNGFINGKATEVTFQSPLSRGTPPDSDNGIWLRLLLHCFNPL